MDISKITEIIKRREADWRSRAGFKQAGGDVERAQLEFEIAQEYTSLLTEIEDAFKVAHHPGLPTS